MIVWFGAIFYTKQIDESVIENDALTFMVVTPNSESVGEAMNRIRSMSEHTERIKDGWVERWDKVRALDRSESRQFANQILEEMYGAVN